MKLRELLIKVVDNRGKTPPLSENGYELIETASLVGDNKFPDYSRVSKRVSKETYDNWFRAGHPRIRDILVATVGANFGSVALMKEARGCVAQNLVALRANQQIVNPDYLYYWLSWSRTHQHLKNLDIGAAQPSLKVPHLLDIDIPLPDLLGQTRIASLLSVYDDLIENNTRRIKILEEMAQMLYREWFVYFRFPGHEKVKMKNGLPEGWEVKTLDDVALNFDSKRIPLSSMQRAERQGEYPYYGAAKILDYIDDYIFDGKYLLIAEDGSVITTDREPVLQMAYGKFWVNNHTHVLQGKFPISTEFLCLVLSDVDISGYITGAAQPKITQANLNRIPIVVAPGELLQKFNQIIENLFSLSETLNKKNTNLRQTRDLLLPRLVSGAIDVNELEIQEG